MLDIGEDFTLFDEEGHFTDVGAAVYVSKKVVPEKLHDHYAECRQCQEDVAQMRRDLNTIQNIS